MRGRIADIAATDSEEHAEATDAGDHDVDHAVQGALGRLTVLLNANDALGSTLDLETGLRRLCGTLVPGLADWCVVDLVDEGAGGLVRRVVEHRIQSRHAKISTRRSRQSGSPGIRVSLVAK